MGMSGTCQTSIKAYALTAISKNEKEQFQAQIAMHYYDMGTLFQQLKGMHLKDELKHYHSMKNTCVDMI
jgi:hypothetical protein